MHLFGKGLGYLRFKLTLNGLELPPLHTQKKRRQEGGHLEETAAVADGALVDSEERLHRLAGGGGRQQAKKHHTNRFPKKNPALWMVRFGD